MNCSDWEHQIAGEVESAALDGHLRECAGCREFAREIEDNRAALEALGVEAGACDAMRSRVLAEIRRERRRLRWWMWPVAAAASAALLCVMVVAPRFRDPEPPRLVRFAKAPKLEEWTVRPARHVLRARPKQAPSVAQNEPLVVKMLTSDPDVIILWLVDQKGDAL